jgi:hypothetical protein
MEDRDDDVPSVGDLVMNDTVDAIDAAIGALLLVRVGLVGSHGIEVPTDALDLALASHEPFLNTRKRFRNLHEVLRGHEVFFDIENTVNEMVVAAVSVGFKVGSAITRT